ncbi:MAG: efflux RND transporter periplasmic adaptor subunit [Kiloniellales bacterium]|nr:efflux RND transporter periplasmic adaptor subunit [Kiloniellales bacterium]
MKRSYVISLLLAIAAIAWVASGQLNGGEEQVAKKPPADLSLANGTAKVRVRTQDAVARPTRTLLRGDTQAERAVDIKSEARGRVIEVAVDKGSRVKAGDVIVRLAPEYRPARLQKAKALLTQRRIEFEAAEKLAKKGFRAETNLAAAKAEVEAAEAEVEEAEVALANLVIKAPFDGVIDDRQMEVGDFADVGAVVARIVDLDPILAVGYASQRDIARLQLGSAGRIRLVGGPELEGRVRFISAVADPETRTFRIELEADNPGSLIPDGLIAELILPTALTSAHRVSPAILSLTDSGTVGVKALGDNSRVEFHPVRIIGEDADGVWLAGLPERVTLITVGQDYVTPGQVVEAIDEATLEPVQQGALE